MNSSETPTALTIAGSDSSGGAGVQADLKTFAAHGVYGLSAITAITAQNTVEVTAIEPVRPDLLVAQIEAVASDFRIDAVKIGMLANEALIDAAADCVRRHDLGPIVLDTVMVAKAGARLLDPSAVDALRTRLLPLATIVTPNVPEAARLTGLTIEDDTDLHAAAERLRAMGARAVLITGGHLDGPAIDVLLDDDRPSVTLEAARIETRHTHGTGCTLSSAIAAQLARGVSTIEAVRQAKAYVSRAIASAPGLGRGHGPLGHLPSVPVDPER